MLLYFEMFSGLDLPLVDWENSVENPPPFLTQQDCTKWLSELSDVALASDAFFPFRDNIDRAVQVNTSST